MTVLPSVWTASKLPSLTLLVLLTLTLLPGTFSRSLPIVAAAEQSLFTNILGAAFKVPALSCGVTVSATSVSGVLTSLVLHAALIESPRGCEEPVWAAAVGCVGAGLNLLWLTSLGEERVVNLLLSFVSSTILIRDSS